MFYNLCHITRDTSNDSALARAKNSERTTRMGSKTDGEQIPKEPRGWAEEQVSVAQVLAAQGPAAQIPAAQVLAAQDPKVPAALVLAAQVLAALTPVAQILATRILDNQIPAA